MNKFLLVFLFATSFLTSEEHKFDAPEEITYDWLSSGRDDRGGTSHVICFKEIFENAKIKTFLEFGIGYSTKYFLDSCTRVISVEVVTPGYGPDRMRRFMEFYKNSSNWTPIAYFSGFQGDMSWTPYKYMGSESVYKAASYQCSTWLHYEQIDSSYLKELNDFMGNLTKYNKVDIALVEPILFLRGDFVQTLFDKVPIIVAHNTVSRAKGRENVFGYVRVKTPPHYEEIYLPTKQENEIAGTTIWVLKKPEHEILIEKLKNLL